MPKFNVVAIGRAYTDIVAHVSTEFLQKYDIPLNGQKEFSSSELQEIYQCLENPQIIPGGASANSMAIVKALGGKAGFFGKVGSDQIGKDFLNDLKQRNIELCSTASPNDKSDMSAISFVLLTDDKRSFAYHAGCADYFSTNDFEKFDFSQTDCFLIEAHLLTSIIAKDSLLQALENAKSKTVIVINLQGAEVSEFGNASFHLPAIKPKKFVSATGAGDAFIAGFLMGLSKGANTKKSMHYGIKTATELLEELGARPTHFLSHLFAKTEPHRHTRFFSYSKELSEGLQDMLQSAFGQGSHTAKNLR